MTLSSTYPQCVAELLDPPVRFRSATIDAVRRFASARPWKGTLDERKAKFECLHAALCKVYGKQTALRWGEIDGGDSGGSWYSPILDLIEINGRLSVVTYLHEFAHALRRDERGACRWSLNLFHLLFPTSFKRCVALGHLLRRPDRAS